MKKFWKKVRSTCYRKGVCPSCKYKIQCLIADKKESGQYCHTLNNYFCGFYLALLISFVALIGRPYGSFSMAIIGGLAIFHIYLAKRGKEAYQRLLKMDEECLTLKKLEDALHNLRHMGVSQPKLHLTPSQQALYSQVVNGK